MKILAVAHETGFTGGANRSFIMVLEKLKKDYNYDIEVLVPKKNGEFIEKLDELGIKWHYIFPYFGSMSSIRNDGKDILRFGKAYIGYFIECFIACIAKLKFKNEKFDCVYTNTRLPAVGALIAKKIKVPHVIHVREFGAEKPLWGFWGYEKVYKLSSKIICISDALLNKFSQYVSTDKLISIHNGIDSPLGLEKSFNVNKDTLDLILTGRIVPDKGQDEAIEAMKILNNKGIKNINLHIVGSVPKRTHIGWYEEKIKKMVKEYGLENNVIFHGEVSDMVNIRKNMDVELMCAIRETFGRVTVEGMRSGLIVIGANTGGTLEIIQDKKTGLLYKQGSAESLSEKILWILNNKGDAKKIADNGYNFAQENFTPDGNVRQIEKVFRDLK